MPALRMNLRPAWLVSRSSNKSQTLIRWWETTWLRTAEAQPQGPGTDVSFLSVVLQCRKVGNFRPHPTLRFLRFFIA